MVALFYVALIGLVLAELIKGLSANGTPPLLQKFSWQLDLAYFMWRNIRIIRLGFALIAAFCIWKVASQGQAIFLIGGAVLALMWGGIFWFFNYKWVGRVKFLPLTRKVFETSATNKIDLTEQVMGVDHNGVQKAYPASMIFYHHQITDEIAGHPIWVTYCGMCRSGRVYDISALDAGQDFQLVGAITFNAVLKDKQTGSWWRQETGEAVKGHHSGTQLEDMSMEQMSLNNWLKKYPHSKILQREDTFAEKYNFFHKLLNYEASLPGWHRQETPPMIIGIEAGGLDRAYDWNQLIKRRLVMDEMGEVSVLMLSSDDGTSSFAYNRSVDGVVLDFSIDGDTLTDSQTQSTWDIFGRCTDGKLKGSELAPIQNYKQFLRAWVSFHPDTSFYAY